MVDGRSHPLGWAVEHQYSPFGRAHGRFVPYWRRRCCGWAVCSVTWSPALLWACREEGVCDAVVDGRSHPLGWAVEHQYSPLPWSRPFRTVLATTLLWEGGLFSQVVPDAAVGVS